ncbi:MAG TPA: hypothetical protein VHP33_38115 [Polyangiaceae bacterium]|nr:hypothetical protein [Polyangiaceae bacterium]
MTRSPRPPAALARFIALLAALVLVGQSLLGNVQLCALVGAFSSDCCEAPCADESEHTAAEALNAGPSVAALEAKHGSDGDCSCPFDCALGCCSPNRALVPQVALLDRPLGESERLGLTEIEQAPPAPDGRGILHVPKRAA